ncbi:MAG: DUF2391 family protein [Planctomycetota bacterium]
MNEQDFREARRGFSGKDLMQIGIGSFMLIYPLAITEEVWDLGESLDIGSTLLLLFTAYAIIGTFVYARVYEGDLAGHRAAFVKRVLSLVVVTLGVSAFCLYGLDKLPLFSDPVVAFKRSILASLPGCFAATVVDSLNL